MSADEILDQLENLSTEELARVRDHADGLLENREVEVSPELLAAIDEADASEGDGTDVSYEEAVRRLKQWHSVK